MRSVAAGQVFDITRSCGAGCDEEGNDWFESRLAEPDVVVEDLISIITPAAHPEHERSVPSPHLQTFRPLHIHAGRLTCASLRRVWFRNVYTETVRPARTCPADGRFVQWADGVTPAAVQPDQPPGPPSSGAERATAALLVGLAAAVVLV